MLMPHRSPLAAVLLLCAGPALATLHDRGGGFIYDDALNLTWLQDMNYSQTSGASVDGLMTWPQAMSWAANLAVLDSVRGITWSDWRLPQATPINGSSWQLAVTFDGSSDWSYNITSPAHEMSHLFHVSLGNLSAFAADGSPRPGVLGVDFGLANTGPFQNFQQDSYWYGTDSPWNPGSHAGGFLSYSGGDLLNAPQGSLLRAMAVREGDVLAVPEPSSWALMLAGGVLLARSALRRRSAGPRTTCAAPRLA